MQDAVQQAYVGDRFWTSTGREITDLPTLKNVDEVDRSAIKELRKHYPNARVVTGRVTSTYLYKRVYHSGNSNLTESFWWVEFVDKDGKESSFSLSAEKPQFQNLKKGAVLSCFWISGLTLTHDIQGADADRIVMNDRTPGAVIIHKDDSQTSFINDAYTPKTKKKIFLFLPAFAISAIFSAYQFDFNKIGLLASFGIGALVFIIEALLQHNDYKKRERAFEAIKTTVAKLIKVSKNTLGFHLSVRQPEPSDVICGGCEQRIPNDALFCPKCGAKQNQQEDKPSNSVIAIEEGILKEVMPLNYIDRYTHKYAMLKNNEADVKVSFMFGRVLSRDTFANVNDITNVTSTFTTYEVYKHGVYMGDKTEEKRSETRTKTSKIEGSVLVRLADGRIEEHTLPEKMTGLLDEGDWFMFAQSKALLDNPTMNIEYAYNLTKDRELSTSSFENYKGRSSFGKWLVRLLVFGGLHWGWSTLSTKFVHTAQTVNNEAMGAVRENAFFIWASNNMFIIENIFIFIFVALTLKWLRKGFTYRKENRNARKAIMAPLKKAIADAKAKLPALKEKILRVV